MHFVPCGSHAPHGEPGSALVVVVMAMLLMAALGSALALIAVTETTISAHYRAGVRTLYAADAAIAMAVAELSTLAEWDGALSGTATSTATDGPPGGVRSLGGTQVDLTGITNVLRCGTSSPCSDGQMAAYTADRPWGINNPRWQLYAWGPMGRLRPSPGGEGDVYVALWVADDPEENDGDPLRDGTAPDNPGRGVIWLLAHAYGPAGARRVIEATIARPTPADSEDEAGGDTGSDGGGGVRMVTWREVR